MSVIVRREVVRYVAGVLVFSGPLLMGGGGPDAQEMRSVRDGVYTDAQAKRGQVVYGLVWRQLSRDDAAGGRDGAAGGRRPVHGRTGTG